MTEQDFLQGNIAIICNEVIWKDWFILKLTNCEDKNECGTYGHYHNRFVSCHDLGKSDIKIARKLIRDGIFSVKQSTNYGIVYENGSNLREKHQRLMDIWNKNLIPELKKEQIREVLNGVNNISTSGRDSSGL